MKKAIVLLLLTLIAGCANWEQHREKMRSEYLGKHIDNAIVRLGVPKGKVSLSDGGAVYEFLTFRGPYRCEDTFITNAKGIITSSKHKGQNGCITPF